MDCAFWAGKRCVLLSITPLDIVRESGRCNTFSGARPPDARLVLIHRKNRRWSVISQEEARNGFAVAGRPRNLPWRCQSGTETGLIPRCAT
jgi:hypothetical protein